MKTFKSFLLDQINEVAKPKAKGEKDFFDAHKVEISDPEDQKNNSAKVVTKDGSGKRKADRLDNKQEMGEEVEQIDEIGNTPAGKEKLKSYIDKADDSVRKLARTSTVGVNSKQRDSIRAKIDKKIDKRLDGMTNALKRIVKSNEEVEITEGKVKELMMDINDVASKMKKNKTLEPFAGKFVTAAKKSLDIKKSLEDVLPDYISGAEIAKLYKEETDFTKKQTTMAHAIGKHFAKKKVGDADKGGPYAVATAMVRDKPDSAEKAYKTIKAKAKNEEHEIALVALYDELNEDNKDALLEKLDRDYDNLINFAMSIEVSDDDN